MAPNVHYRYSAAVEYAQSQWERVTNRVHYTMKEDGFVALVDSSHQVTTNVDIQNKIDQARLWSLFEVQPTSAQRVAQITVNKLAKSRLSPFEQASFNEASEPSSSDSSYMNGTISSAANSMGKARVSTKIDGKK